MLSERKIQDRISVKGSMIAITFFSLHFFVEELFYEKQTNE